MGRLESAKYDLMCVWPKRAKWAFGKETRIMLSFTCHSAATMAFFCAFYMCALVNFFLMFSFLQILERSNISFHQRNNSLILFNLFLIHQVAQCYRPPLYCWQLLPIKSDTKLIKRKRGAEMMLSQANQLCLVFIHSLKLTTTVSLKTQWQKL